MSTRYLKNTAKPYYVTFPAAHYETGKNGKPVLVKKRVNYLNEKGQLVTFMHDKEDEEVTVLHYPHITDFRFGPAGFPEKEKRIIILCGQIAKTSDEKLFKALWDTYAFLDEVDANGNLVRKNKEQREENKATPPPEMQMATALKENINA